MSLNVLYWVDDLTMLKLIKLYFGIEERFFKENLFRILFDIPSSIKF